MENKKYVELLWNNKYPESWFKEYFELRKNATIPIDRPSLAFQTVESINVPRAKGLTAQKLFPEEAWPANYPKDWKNLLIWGDNKLVMSSLLGQFAGKINLIYIDPPFFTGADFTVKTKVGDEEVTKEPSIIEEKAYRDTWAGGMASYLRYMYERLVLMKELLADNGSIYVHLDWHVGHYVKIIMDEIFGYDNFINEVVWAYRTGGASERCWSQKHDVILFYSKTDKYTFNTQKEKAYTKSKSRKPGVVDYGGGTAEFFEDEDGVYTWVIARDVWEVPYINSQAYERLHFGTQKPEALLKRIILASSNPGDIVADFFCGSGTTLAVAEKLGRRWIGCDLSKFAIHTTRKRLMDIHNSKDLLDENKESYGQPARPFEILNIGSYEIRYWQEKPAEYLNFMLKLYQAQPVSGFRYLHGKKGNRLVHVSSLNAPVSMDEVRKTVLECADNGFNKLDILGWEWSYEVNDLAKHLAKEKGIDLRLIQIPSVNEIKSALVGFDLRLLKVPEEVIERRLLEQIRFSEVSYLEVETKVKDNQATIKISDFQVAPSPWLDEVKDSIKKYYDLIDYWAVDWNYQGDTFHNQWQTYRTKKNPKIDLEASKKYEKEGEYVIMVKVVDVFGNDTSKLVKVKIK